MKCENIKCNNEHNGLFGSGRFCSRSCANKRKHSKEIRDKISKTAKKNSGFSNEEHKQKFIESGKIAREKWRKHRRKEMLSANFSNLGPTDRRNRILHEQNNKCNKCGIDKWMGYSITLEIDHIDGNTKNNTRNNLEGLCPNCHSQTDTFRGKNRGRYTSKSDDELFEAFLQTGNMHKALISLGMAPKGANYKRFKKILNKFNETS